MPRTFGDVSSAYVVTGKNRQKHTPALILPLGLAISISLLGRVITDSLGISQSEPLVSILLLTLASMVLAFKADGSARHLWFQLLNAVLWTTYWAARTMMVSGPAAGLAGTLLEFGFACSVAGALLIVMIKTLRQRRSSNLVC